MKVSVKVPATTANLGPGFDCLGIALPIYNEITVEETVMPGSGIEINIIEESETFDILSIPKNKDNIVYKAIELLYNFVGQSVSDIKITIKTNIPVTRGLGSSASVIVGGLIAANELLGRPADEKVILSIAAEVEGHPDNVTPALFGGFCLSSLEKDGSVIYSKIPWPENWKLTLLIPDYELDTRIARSVLPESINISDAAFNVRKCAMLIDAVYKKDSELMKRCLTDKLHQPYRENLVKGFKEINELITKKEDIIGCVISGAGPSILVISQNNGFEKAENEVTQVLDDLNVVCDIRTLNIENNGSRII
ncbi:MAG: homoserine kinase [Candidatus Gastranaerophilales bacterium]|nr:homoserine kinase [Candidatus Gastranaerophilales bacterium]